MKQGEGLGKRDPPDRQFLVGGWGGWGGGGGKGVSKE